jgi:hypothetical protein
MRTRMPIASAMPIAALLFASLITGEAMAGPKPPEPPQKPKPPAAAPAATPAATTTAAPAATATTTAPAATATTTAPAATAPTTAAASASAAKPAASGATATASGGGVAPVKLNEPGLSTGSHDSRLAALAKLIEERKGTIDARRKAEQDQTRVRWGNVVEQPAVVAELKTHAERVARLNRIQELADVEGKPAVATRAGRALAAENVRHEKQMQSLAGGAK